MEIGNLNREQLIDLRKQIVMGSLFYSDYENNLDIDTHQVCDFFDGFMEELCYQMENEIPNYNDNMYWDLIEQYDADDRLWDYYCSIEWEV